MKTRLIMLAAGITLLVVAANFGPRQVGALDLEARVHNRDSMSADECVACHFGGEESSHALLYERYPEEFGNLLADAWTGAGGGGGVSSPDVMPLCLACHDGQTAREPIPEYDSRLLYKGAPITPFTPGVLRHHPFGVAYPENGNDAMKPARAVIAQGVRLHVHATGANRYFVECPACHFMHGTEGPALLRQPGELCFGCHWNLAGVDVGAVDSTGYPAPPCRACHPGK